jgi:purine operon repressor
MTAIMHMLSSEPNRVFPLSHFCDMLGIAKSTASEDIAELNSIAMRFGIGELHTISGASGGVRFRRCMARGGALAYIQALSDKLSGASRVLPGGFLYLSDILSDPQTVGRMGTILAGEYDGECPDFVLTMETMGIPVALMTADALGVPLLIARHSSGKVYEGSAVNISYVSGSSGAVETMSLPRRAVREGQRALIVDDFLKGGGTAKGMADLMSELNVSVIGMAFVMTTARPEKKRITGEKCLMIMDIADSEAPDARVRPADWLKEAEHAQ